MTVYETIMVILGVIGSLMSLGMLIIALLNFLRKSKELRKGRSPRDRMRA